MCCERRVARPVPGTTTRWGTHRRIGRDGRRARGRPARGRPAVGGAARRRVAHVLRTSLVVGVALALLVVATAVVVPGARAAAKAPFVLAGALDSAVPLPGTADVDREQAVLGDVVVDRYSRSSPAPPVLLVPGAARDGREDERVVSLATSLAAAGRQVVVPELALYEQELDLVDVDRIVQVAEALCAPGDGLVLLGFSFGGSLALVAAGDPRVAACIDLVATFGAYADLVGMVQAAATGVSVVNGEQYRWRSRDESVARQVLQDAATDLVPQEQREKVRQALAEDDPSGLSQASRAVYRMVTTEDPYQVPAMVPRLPPRGQQVLERLSPVAVADRTTARVLAAHALDDPAVPYAELIRLRKAFPEADTMIVESFEHVDFTTTRELGTLLSDLITAYDFVRGVLRRQEHWPWESPGGPVGRRRAGS